MKGAVQVNIIAFLSLLVKHFFTKIPKNFIRCG